MEKVIIIIPDGGVGTGQTSVGVYLACSVVRTHWSLRQRGSVGVAF